jgi:hypothetical protein
LIVRNNNDTDRDWLPRDESSGAKDDSPKAIIFIVYHFRSGQRRWLESDQAFSLRTHLAALLRFATAFYEAAEISIFG